MSTRHNLDPLGKRVSVKSYLDEAVLWAWRIVSIATLHAYSTVSWDGV